VLGAPWLAEGDSWQIFIRLAEHNENIGFAEFMAGGPLVQPMCMALIT
jgi:hypothetical protein